MTEAKICGLSTDETVLAAINSGAKYIGFVFFPRSPRNVSIEQASKLAATAGKNVLKVGVFVNPDDAFLTDVLKDVDLDIIQLHGNETNDRINQVRERFSKTVMKAISVASVNDINKAREYEKSADILLFDAKAPVDMDHALPGGNGLAFDWNLIAGYQWQIPWMLSGGLDINNVREAIKISGAGIVDISSGLETAPGNKDINMIEAFMNEIQETAK